MTNNNILINNNNVVIKIKEMKAGWIYYSCSNALDILNDYIVDYDNIESIDDLEDKLRDVAWEWAEAVTPVYTSAINKAFSKIEPWQVDELSKEFGIEYDGESFDSFQMSIIFAKYEQDAQEEISTLIENLEEIQKEVEAVEGVRELVKRYCYNYYNAHIMDYINEGLTDHVVDYILTYYSDEEPDLYDLYCSHQNAVEEDDELNSILLHYYTENKERWENSDR
ncbi:MAG: hypothetical protein MSA15_21385 [Clostridium sp.]|nr:hypothetical protein [Clostridium sp.]